MPLIQEVREGDEHSSLVLSFTDDPGAPHQVAGGIKQGRSNDDYLMVRDAPHWYRVELHFANVTFHTLVRLANVLGTDTATLLLKPPAKPAP